MLQIPFIRELDKAQTILLAGCGGGYDVFCGLPFYFGLRDMGKTVHLANLSFSSLHDSTRHKLPGGMVRVDAKTEGSERYFPEKYLAQWLASEGIREPIYCFGRSGVKPLTTAYAWLVEHLGVDAILLVDGGTDSLMRGDEIGLGTPEEDCASLAAVQATDVSNKWLACVGFGVDTFHGVCHAQFLEAVAAITQAGGFLGAWTLTPEMPEVQKYREACDYTHRHMFNHPSIVSSSILSAIEGHFGDYHATYRTEGSKLFINPLMTLYWTFQLEAVASRNLYLNELRDTESYRDVVNVINAFRARNVTHIKDWQSLPM